MITASFFETLFLRSAAARPGRWPRPNEREPIPYEEAGAVAASRLPRDAPLWPRHRPEFRPPQRSSLLRAFHFRRGDAGLDPLVRAGCLLQPRGPRLHPSRRASLEAGAGHSARGKFNSGRAARMLLTTSSPCFPYSAPPVIHPNAIQAFRGSDAHDPSLARCPF